MQTYTIFLGWLSQPALLTVPSMADRIETLTEKERETLRLIVTGHDAKSAANKLNLSVHTINERLRAARRKLSVTSSREAARILLEYESGAPENFGYKLLGEASQADSSDSLQASSNPEFQDMGRLRKPALIIGGIVIMSLALALFVVSPSVLPIDAALPEESRTTSMVAADTKIETAARKWLALVDVSDWQGSYDAAGQSFKKLNTVENWKSASLQARVPLGQSLERRAINFENVNAPPHGYKLVRFRTNFANRQDVIETVTLEYEANRWAVVGYLID